jgi:hypothetical protein
MAAAALDSCIVGACGSTGRESPSHGPSGVADAEELAEGMFADLAPGHSFAPGRVLAGLAAWPVLRPCIRRGRSQPAIQISESSGALRRPSKPTGQLTLG